ncbi:NfeD family protein [Clostridium sp.]|uniref:NfeD family protein n=4 Tax=Clostridium sp. TaxID=1506 RepID=UPI002FC7E18F
MKKRGIKLFLIMLALTILIPSIQVVNGAISDKGVYVIPIKGDIGPSIEGFLSDQLKKAKESNIGTVILDINTLGGRVDSTLNIQETIKSYSNDFKFYSFINNKAESAGVMLALLGDKIFMTEDATIGSAAVVPYDEKVNSAWASMLKAQAESKGKPSDIARATADYNFVIKDVKDKGTLLNMSANEAIKYKFADGKASSIAQVINEVGYRGDKVIHAQKSFKVTLTEIISNPMVSTLLLLLGMTFLVAEIFIPSFGILGTLGATSIGAYFLGNVFAGHSSWWAVGLFLLGVILMIIEINIIGFGAAGIGGVILTSVGIVMSAETLKMGLVLMICSWVVIGIGVFLLLKYGLNKGPFKKVINSMNQDGEEYISYNSSLNSLLGKEGVTVTKLRPSGEVNVDNEIYQMQSISRFIDKNKTVTVIKVEGNNIFVREVE